MIESLTTCDQRPNHEVSLQPWMSDLSTIYHLLGQTLDHTDTFLQPSDDFRRHGALHLPTIAVVVYAWLWVDVTVHIILYGPTYMNIIYMQTHQHTRISSSLP